MQITKLFLRLLSKPFIHLWLFLYGVRNYTINKDNTVDVDGNVYLMFSTFLFFIPIQFNEVNGNFSVAYSNLFSLRGCPKIVNGNFDCSYTCISSLNGGPEFVVQKYECGYNKFLISLKGSPLSVGESFFAWWCDLKSLKHTPLQVGGNIHFSGARISHKEAIDFFNTFNGNFGGKISYSNEHPQLKNLDLFYEDSRLLSITKQELLYLRLKNQLEKNLVNKSNESNFKSVKI